MAWELGTRSKLGLRGFGFRFMRVRGSGLERLGFRGVGLMGVRV